MTNDLFIQPAGIVEGRKFRTGNAIIGVAYDFERHLLAVVFKPAEIGDPAHCMVYAGVPPKIWRAFPTGLNALGFYLNRISGVYAFESGGTAESAGLDVTTADLLPDTRQANAVRKLTEQRSTSEAKWREASAYGKTKPIPTEDDSED